MDGRARRVLPRVQDDSGVEPGAHPAAVHSALHGEVRRAQPPGDQEAPGIGDPAAHPRVHLRAGVHRAVEERLGVPGHVAGSARHSRRPGGVPQVNHPHRDELLLLQCHADADEELQE